MSNQTVIRKGPCIGCFNNKSNVNDEPCAKCTRTTSSQADKDKHLTITLNVAIREARRVSFDRTR